MTKFEDKTAVDFVIVGAGGAGGIVAKELSTARFQVVVLEQGPDWQRTDLISSDVWGRRIRPAEGSGTTT